MEAASRSDLSAVRVQALGTSAPMNTMYSFSYMPIFQQYQTSASLSDFTWSAPTIPGFEIGNPKNYRNFVLNGNFGMTAFMTPVNELFN